MSKTPTCLNVTSTEVRCIRPSTSPISKLVFRANGGDGQLRPGRLTADRVQRGDGDDLYVGARTAAGTRVDFEGGSADSDLAHDTNAGRASMSPGQSCQRRASGGKDRDNIHKDVTS